MNLTLKTLIVSVMCISVVNCTFLDSLTGLLGKSEHKTEHKLSKRQVPYLPDGSFMDYAAYDYYDWVCSGGFCQICDVLSGLCCNPSTQANCFLPDSCANNPCLSGGTCVNTFTVAGNQDFTCVCQRGLTGKYCQLIDEFTPPLVAPLPPVAVPAPAPAQAYGAQPAQTYGAQPAQAYGAQPQAYGAQPAQAYAAQPAQAYAAQPAQTYAAQPQAYAAQPAQAYAAQPQAPAAYGAQPQAYGAQAQTYGK